MQIGRVASSELSHVVSTEATRGASVREAAASVAAARDVARSALINERFRLALEQLVSPALSGALMQMKDDGGSRTNLRSAVLCYSEASAD